MKNFLHHLFVPRQSNNHRSKVLHYEVLLLVVAFLLSGLITITGVEKQYPAVLGDSVSISVQDLVTYTNLKRQSNGLAPLTLNKELSVAAGQKAKHMFAQDYWAHVAPDGTTPWVFIKDSGYQYLYAGENLARGFDSSTEVVDAWMESPTHRENLLSPNYTDIGFAVLPGALTGSETVLVVQMFGSPYETKEAEDTVAGTQVNPTPTQTPVASGLIQESQPYAGVAAVQSNPLIDTDTAKRNTSYILLVFFIVILVLDAVIIERRKIVRAFSHNIDHILFLAFILIAGIIIGKGVIL
ncbi:MAG: hypothetical protein H0W89_03405 [Candidatus Levybacteria bacterium]|nr:hypothetical protein [Candidatus Levybacteria bacterium]